MAAATAHKFPEGLEVYDDDASFGKPAPSLKVLEEKGNYVKEGPVNFGDGGRPTVVLFFARYAKGEYHVQESISRLAEEFAGRVNFIGVNVDAEKSEATKYVSKIGERIEELRVTIQASFPVAWDEDKELANQYKALAKLASFATSDVFLVNAEGVVVWRERFSKNYTVEKGLLKTQVEKVLAGEELVKVGNDPDGGAAEGEEEEEAVAGGAEDDEEDLGLF